MEISYIKKGVWQGTTFVAAKKLKKDEMLETFMAEAELLQKLAHPHIVQVSNLRNTSFSYFSQFLGLYTEINQVKYLITEFMSKGSLKTLLQEDSDKLTLSHLLYM